MKWLREAISDSDGVADVAYVVILMLAGAAIATLAYIIAMATVSYIRCTHIVDVGQGIKAAIACQFDPLPIGQAAGLVFAAFATLIGALSAYMVSTRRAASGATKTTTVLTQDGAATETVTPAADPAPTKIKKGGR